MITDPTLVSPVEYINKRHKPSKYPIFYLAELFKPVYPDGTMRNHRKKEIIATEIMKTGVVSEMSSREEAVYS